MKRTRNFKILLFLLVSIFCISIGYAAISNITLTINGSAHAEVDNDLRVKFSSLANDIETSSTCLSDSGTTTSCATISASVTSDKVASFTISGLKGYGDVAIVRYKILNESSNSSALLNITATTNTNSEYFTITTDLSNAASQTISAGSYTILTVKAKVNKVLYTSSSQSTTVTVTDATVGLDTSSLKYIWNQSSSNPTVATFNSSGTAFTINASNQATITTPADLATGNNWYLHIMAKDTLGNTRRITSSPFYIDNTGPTISISPNGADWSKNQSVTITVTDANVGTLDSSSLKNLWSTSTSTPAESKFTGTGNYSGTFSSGGTINSPSVDIQGKWYLWILAKDTLGNTTRKKSNVFWIDNVAPTVAISRELSDNTSDPVEQDDFTIEISDTGSGLNETFNTACSLIEGLGAYSQQI